MVCRKNCKSRYRRAENPREGTVPSITMKEILGADRVVNLENADIATPLDLLALREKIKVQEMEEGS